MASIMTIKDVAHYLDMKEQTVYRLAQQGKLPGLKLGGQWKFKKEHLDALFDEMLTQQMDKLKTTTK